MSQSKKVDLQKSLKENPQTYEESRKQFSEELQAKLKQKAWSHYAIDDTIQGQRVRLPRCDKYSDYALVLSCVFMRDVEEVLKELLEGS